MKVIDLTHIITERMPVYPGTLPPKLTVATTCEDNGFRETLLSMYSHTGTHVDAPAHIFVGRTSLDAFSAEQFVGKALVIDCSDLPAGSKISLERVTRYADAPRAEFLLFRTGWDRFWGSDAYFGEYPFLETEVLDYVLRGGYKGIGFDTIGLDPIGSLVLHKKLFANGEIINIENLTNLDLCGDGLFEFCCLPLKFEQADGAPARAIAYL